MALLSSSLNGSSLLSWKFINIVINTINIFVIIMFNLAIVINLVLIIIIIIIVALVIVIIPSSLSSSLLSSPLTCLLRTSSPTRSVVSLGSLVVGVFDLTVSLDMNASSQRIFCIFLFVFSGFVDLLSQDLYMYLCCLNDCSFDSAQIGPKPFFHPNGHCLAI